MRLLKKIVRRGVGFGGERLTTVQQHRAAVVIGGIAHRPSPRVHQQGGRKQEVVDKPAVQVGVECTELTVEGGRLYILNKP